MNSCKEHSMVHGTVSINQSFSLAKANIDFGTKYQFVIIHVQSQKASFSGKKFGHITTKPNRFSSLDWFGSIVHQDFNWLIVVNGLTTSNYISQTINSVCFAWRIIGPWISDQTNFVRNIEMLLDMKFVKIFWRNGTYFVMLFGLVIVFPSKGLGWNAKANSNNPEKNGNFLSIQVRLCYEWNPYL